MQLSEYGLYAMFVGSQMAQESVFYLPPFLAQATSLPTRSFIKQVNSSSLSTDPFFSLLCSLPSYSCFLLPVHLALVGLLTSIPVI